MLADAVPVKQPQCFEKPCLALACPAARPAPPQDERQEPDADFKPNLINTVCFLVNFVIQVGACTACAPPDMAGPGDGLKTCATRACT